MLFSTRALKGSFIGFAIGSSTLFATEDKCQGRHLQALISDMYKADIFAVGNCGNAVSSAINACEAAVSADKAAKAALAKTPPTSSPEQLKVFAATHRETLSNSMNSNNGCANSYSNAGGVCAAAKSQPDAALVAPTIERIVQVLNSVKSKCAQDAAAAQAQLGQSNQINSAADMMTGSAASSGSSPGSGLPLGQGLGAFLNGGSSSAAQQSSIPTASPSSPSSPTTPTQGGGSSFAYNGPSSDGIPEMNDQYDSSSSFSISFSSSSSSSDSKTGTLAVAANLGDTSSASSSTSDPFDLSNKQRGGAPASANESQANLPAGASAGSPAAKAIASKEGGEKASGNAGGAYAGSSGGLPGFKSAAGSLDAQGAPLFAPGSAGENLSNIPAAPTAPNVESAGGGSPLYKSTTLSALDNRRVLVGGYIKSKRPERTMSSREDQPTQKTLDQEPGDERKGFGTAVGVGGALALGAIIYLRRRKIKRFFKR